MANEKAADAKISETASPATVVEEKPTAYNQSVAALRVLIEGTVAEKHIPARGERDAMTIFEQRCILIGGSHDVHFSNGGTDRKRCYRPGVYMISKDIFGLGNFGELKTVQYMDGDKFIFVRDMTDGERAKFAVTRTNVEELLG